MAGDGGLLGAGSVAGVGGGVVLLALIARAVVARCGCHLFPADDEVDFGWIGKQELYSRIAITKWRSAVDVEEQEAMRRASS